MYSATLPSYESKRDKNSPDKKQEVVKADDPRNRERVRQIFDSFD